MSGFPDFATIEEFRLFSEGAMPDTVTILSYGPSTAAPGGGVARGGTTETTTTGRLLTGKSAQVERERAGQIVSPVAPVLAIPVEAAVKGTDRVRITSARFGTVTTYTIEAVVPLGSFSAHRTLILGAV